MQGELRQRLVGAPARELLESQAYTVVQPGAAGRAEALVERLVDEGVGEVELAHPLLRLPQQRGCDGRLEVVEYALFSDLRRGREQLHVEHAADHRCELERVGRLRPQPGDPTLDDLADALREAQRRVAFHPPAPCRLVVGEGARFGQAAHDLAGEEGVACGLAGDVLGERQPLGVEIVARHRLQYVRHVLRREPVQGDPVRARHRPEVGEHLGERVLAAEVRVAVGDHHLERLALDVAHEVLEQGDRLRVAPMQVVDHDA